MRVPKFFYILLRSRRATLNTNICKQTVKHCIKHSFGTGTENFLFCACENEKFYIICVETLNSLKPTPDPSSRGKIPPPSLWPAKHSSSICCSCHISCQLSHETVCSHQDVEVRKPFHRGVLRHTRRCSTVRNHPQQTTTVCRGRDALRSVPGSAGVKPCAV